MMEGNTEEPQTESGRAGTGVCWWKRRALRRGHGSWCSNVGVVLGLCANLWLLGAHGKSVGFLQLSSRPSKLICTDPNPSPSSTVQDPQKVETTQIPFIAFMGNWMWDEQRMEYYPEYCHAATWMNVENMMLKRWHREGPHMAWFHLCEMFGTSKSIHRDK